MILLKESFEAEPIVHIDHEAAIRFAQNHERALPSPLRTGSVITSDGSNLHDNKIFV